VHIQGTNPDFNQTELLFRSHGWQEFYSASSPELTKFADQPQGKGPGWGFTDRAVFGCAVEWLKTREARRPFLLTIATMDTHVPYAGGSLLESVHSTDAAFGILWNYIKSTGLSTNTAVLFLADHAPRPDPEYVRLRGASYSWSATDWIAAALYAPGNVAWGGRHAQTLCCQLDVTPMILEMMGIDLVNPFLGLPIFSDREKHELLNGVHFLDDGQLGGEIPTRLGTNEITVARELIQWADEHRQVLPH
jgi:phosphoglycerol transferase MdoB-like AlkP superfamily enzyme